MRSGEKQPNELRFLKIKMVINLFVWLCSVELQWIVWIGYVTGNEYIEEEIIDEFGNKTIVRKKVKLLFYFLVIYCCLLVMKCLPLWTLLFQKMKDANGNDVWVTETINADGSRTIVTEKIGANGERIVIEEKIDKNGKKTVVKKMICFLVVLAYWIYMYFWVFLY